MWRVLVVVIMLGCLAACRPDDAAVEGFPESDGSEVTTVPQVTTAPEWQPPTTDPPVDASVVQPGEDLQAALDREGAKATVVIGEGVHRVGAIQPHDGQSIVGQPGAVLSGAEPIEDFAQQGEVWVAPAPVVIEEERGRCLDPRPACGWPQELFVAGEIIRRVADPSAVEGSSWFLDFKSGSIMLGFDPGNDPVELSTRQVAFAGQAEEVTLKGLVIEKYASLAQFGTIRPQTGWVVEGNEIRLNHGAGIKISGGVTIRDNYFHGNGQFALSGGGNDVLIEGNEIAHNGIGGFQPLWAAGGTKFVHSNNLVVRDNLVYENFGPGLWTDGSGDETLYEGNRVFDNAYGGIKHEISGSAIIRDNEVRGNGFSHEVPLRGAGILVRESGPTQILSNVIAGNIDQLVLLQDDGRKNDTGNRLDQAEVRDNQITLGDGMVGYTGDIRNEASIVFAENHYTGDPDVSAFVALGDELTYEAWLDLGQDPESTFSRPTEG